MGSRPTVPECLDEAVALVRDANGGGLHIVLVDGNIAVHHVRWCLEEAAVRDGQPDHRLLAAKMLLMTKTQRLRLARKACEIAFAPAPVVGPSTPDVFGLARHTFTTR